MLVEDSGAWLLVSGVAWGRDWLGLRLEVEVVWGRAARLLGAGGGAAG